MERVDHRINACPFGLLVKASATALVIFLVALALLG
ncbi:hypothetical protein GGR39_000937 [Novosphingobium fluoreni]|uniref:Uncharacterized protein n=1 Tax=Novosphingobium fluoreni TaxID=1391222 RepID=A0A7W6C6J2_9SPHN|nr:hypothetical protein [Novosphingobium fluoreni]